MNVPESETEEDMNWYAQSANADMVTSSVRPQECIGERQNPMDKEVTWIMKINIKTTCIAKPMDSQKLVWFTTYKRS